jgi:predicted O-linked N-acetylglucosamine transferase (SPINDLY family)
VTLSSTANEPGAIPQESRAWTARAQRLMNMRRFSEAVEASDHALALDPGNIPAARVGIVSRLQICDWRRREQDERRISGGIAAGNVAISPFFHRIIADSESESLSLARIAAKSFPPSASPFWRGEIYRHDKIRVGYLSTDFRDHVVADVIVGCFEHHDRTRFETTAISLGPDDSSDMRRRLEAAFYRFVDAQAMNNTEIATMLRELEIDIAVDLNGNSGRNRTSILAHRPAPAQVNYLGYPGTMGVPFFDYIIADSTVIPPEHQIYYTEDVIYLPNSYLPIDGNRRLAEKTPSRMEVGLPDSGFVFACHNGAHKIAPETFDVWMHILQAVEDSVLWLRSSDSAVMGNLRQEAKMRGVAPRRLVFAPRLPSAEDHLARLRLANLFLDTLPYNGHASAADALWCGLPVLTCLGKTFPGRVAASLLRTADLPELVTSSLAEYEELAIGLARDPGRLAGLKTKLARNRTTGAGFAISRFTRDLEAAYQIIWQQNQRGLPPRSFSVNSDGHSSSLSDS